MTRPDVPPSFAPMQILVTRVLPGRSQSIQLVRQQILDFASSPTAKSVLIRGPIGSGKSTIARLIGLLKRVAPLNVDEATRMAITDVKFDAPNRIDIRLLNDWYVELPLTGLVESLVDLQLFGATKGAYTGGTGPRAGLFETAMRGRSESHQDAPRGAEVTGGVVFLDEIGDLSPLLQAKLLPVLSGGAFYRLGGESGKSLSFHGTTITASWKELDATNLRPDLLSRIAPTAIDVPGLAERMDDFDEIYAQLERALMDAIGTEITRIMRVDPNVDREYWKTRLDHLKPTEAAVRRRLAKVEWNRHGNMRGLAAAIERLLTTDQDATAVATSLPRTDATSDTPTANDNRHLLSRLLDRAQGRGGLLAHLSDIESEDRLTLKHRLLGDENARRSLSERLAIPAMQLNAQIKELGRRRVMKQR